LEASRAVGEGFVCDAKMDKKPAGGYSDANTPLAIII